MPRKTENRQTGSVPEQSPSPVSSEAGFIAIIAALMALAAMSIDIILPSITSIGAHFRSAGTNDGQWVMVVFLIGFGVSQPVFGVLTDRFGRKPFLSAALCIYVLMSILCVVAPDYRLLLAARLIQGMAAGGVRVIATSAVRDLYVGRNMARIMSLVMMVFMAAPVFAPGLGQFIQSIGDDWRPVFWFLCLYALVVLIWSFWRFPETLPKTRRIKLDWPVLADSCRRVMTTGQTVGYALANGMMFGVLFGAIIASEQIFRHTYVVGNMFPLYFAGGGVAMIVANFCNSRLVMTLGMRFMSHSAVLLLLISGAAHALLAVFGGGSASLAIFYPMFLLVFFCVGLSGPNFNALAMEKVGDIAGIASALLGATATLSAGILGGISGQLYDGHTIKPLLYNSGMALAAAVIIAVTEKQRLTRIIFRKSLFRRRD